MSTYKFQVTSGSATASGDLTDIAAGVRNDSMVQVNPTNLAYGVFSVDASGRLQITGNLGITGSVGITGGSLSAVTANQGTSPWVVSANNLLTVSAGITGGSVGVTANALTAYVSGQVTAVQGGSPWGVSANNLTSYVSGALSATATIQGTATAVISAGLQSFTRGSATAAGDMGFPAMFYIFDAGTSGFNPTNDKWGWGVVDSSGHLWTRNYGTALISATNLLTVSAGVTGGSLGITGGSLSAVTANQGTSPWVVSASNLLTVSAGITGGSLGITGGSLSAVTANQGTSPWVVSANNVLTVGTATLTGLSAVYVTASGQVTAWLSGTATVSGQVSATARVSSWGASAISDATAITAGMGLTWSVPMIGAIPVGYRNDGTSNYDPAMLAKLFDLNSGAGQENVLGASIRVSAAGGSLQLGGIDNAAPAASGFTDGTSPVMPVGFLYDESAGTTPSEDDLLASRVDIKRAQVVVLEDVTTRGTTNRLSINTNNAALVQQYFATASAGAATSTGGTGPISNAVTGGSLTLSISAPKFWTLYTMASASGSATATGFVQLSPNNSNWFNLMSAATTIVNGTAMVTATAQYIHGLFARIIASATLATGGVGNSSATASAWMVGGN